MNESVLKLQELWSAVQRYGTGSTIHALVSHAQDMEADRIATLLDEMLEQPERLANVDGDIIVHQLAKAIRARTYRPEPAAQSWTCSCGHDVTRHNSLGCVDCDCLVRK